MKKITLVAMLLLSSLTTGALLHAAGGPAFPGAEGFARYTTTGGRGGNVYHVTSLADTNTNGTLRYGLTRSEALIIVFDVSGYIDLKSDLAVKSNKTVAGQTAPGDGITLRYRTVTFTGCDNVIFRFIRFRRSQIEDVNDGADASWGRRHRNIILDHCSFSWSIDEVASFYDNRDFTMQWCTLGEGLANPGHTKGEHSYGGIWGGKGASFHHNFIAHVQNRSPRFNGARYNWSGYDASKYANALQAEQVDFRNCVMYNWGTGGSYGGPGGGYINMINNYYKAGPGTKNKTRVTQVSVQGSSDSFNGYASRYYIAGNYVTAAGTQAQDYDWKGVVYDNGLSTIGGERYIPDAGHLYGPNVTYVKNGAGTDCVRLRLDEPIEAGEVTTHTAQVAYEKVLAYAGASLARDAVDARYMEETRTGTVTYTGTVTQRAGIVDIVSHPLQPTPNLPCFPELKSENRPAGFDSDGDGMPDEWEDANGLDKHNAADGKTYTLDGEHGWYTNLEVYVNSLVEDIVKAQNADALTSVDEYYPAVVSSGLTAARPESAISRVEYYDLKGRRLPSPKGLCVRRIYYRDGSMVASRVLTAD